ncbi:hypothetical protein OESDEN_12912 [Oesophagostomum dentatum]|uniref:Uncharacterized protein n=1 Tax=Oesophagostomum dentatum TaxID=61180 RepID=A0A0B1STU7_OESDE|nr:hypothetical protein OESDEN_12912 [Oesophagostomum dentatum]
MTEALEPEKEIPKEQAETNPPAATIPDVKPVEEKPVEIVPTATKEYILNEEAAADYWATAKFETTAAPSVPMAEALKPVEEVPEEEAAQTNPHVEPAPEEKPVEEKPVEVTPSATTEYVLNEEAAADYWATAKYEATTVPSESKTEASPEKKPEKPIKKPLMPSILGGKGIVIEKKEQKKYWIHKPFGHPKNIGNWHLTKPLKPCLQKKPTEKLVDCQP